MFQLLTTSVLDLGEGILGLRRKRKDHDSPFEGQNVLNFVLNIVVYGGLRTRPIYLFRLTLFVSLLPTSGSPGLLVHGKTFPR